MDYGQTLALILQATVTPFLREAEHRTKTLNTAQHKTFSSPHSRTTNHRPRFGQLPAGREQGRPHAGLPETLLSSQTPDHRGQARHSNTQEMSAGDNKE